MPQGAGPVSQSRYVPALEGIRGYGFVAVFIAHYFPPNLFKQSLLLYPALCLTAIASCAVPAFFVLSGYLIGGILYDTREREGYFKVFYSRRILRVFPVYYLSLLVVALADSHKGISLDYRFWMHFLYIQNLIPGYEHLTGRPAVQLGHFWSLAVEEQFYLLWPLVVWVIRDRRSLVKITCLLIAASCIYRLAAPWTGLTPDAMYLVTPSRIDAILLGVLLVFARREKVYDRIVPAAKFVACGGLAFMALRAIWERDAWAYSYLGTGFLYPVINITALAVVVAVMEEGSWFVRACSGKWICRLGSLTYSLYVFHLIYSGYFLTSLGPRLAAHMPQPVAYLVSGSAAFCFTVLLAMLSYRFVERPALNLKNSLKYGAVKKEPGVQAEEAKPMLANTGT